MQPLKNRFLAVCIVGSISVLLCLASMRLALSVSFMRFISSTEEISEQYLNAIINGDEEQAMSLTIPECRERTLKRIREDISNFSESDIRNIEISVQNGTGSDEGIQLAQIFFEYRKSEQPAWRIGEITIATDLEGSGVRYLICGG